MQINVAQLLKSPVGEVRNYPISGSIRDSHPIQGDVKLVRTNRSILVTGRFTTVVKEICSRCLEEFEYVSTFDIEEEYSPQRDIFKGLPLQEVDEETFCIGEDHTLDLSEALRQNLVLNLATKPVCRPECAGLCHQCGSNLNHTLCNCAEARIEHSWSPLKLLLADGIAES